ncbi:MICAL C-terminal, partial [Brachionus plicatilis]
FGNRNLLYICKKIVTSIVVCERVDFAGGIKTKNKPEVAFDTSDYFNELQRDKFEKRCNFYLSSCQTKRAAGSDSSNYSTPNTSFSGAGEDADTTPFKLRERAEFESILESEECNNSKEEEEEETEEKVNLDGHIFSDSDEHSQSDDDHFYSIDTKYITLRNSAQKPVSPSTSNSKSQSKSQSPHSSSPELNNKIIQGQLNEQVDVYLMRKRAQERAKLKSDEELGLHSAIVIRRAERRASSGDEYEDVFNSPPEIKRQSFDFDCAPLAKCETLEEEEDDDSEPKRALIKADLKLSLGSDSSSSNDELSSSSLIESFNALNVDNSPRVKRSAINRKRVLNEEKKMVKQNQDRLRRMAQQLQRKLDELRHKKDEFSGSVTELEKRINALDLHSLCYESVKKTLEAKLLNFIHCKNILLRIENELIIQSEALAIEDRLSECQLKLKETIDLPEEKKSGQIRQREKWLMERLVDFIEEKDRLVDQLEKLKVMESEEDKFVVDMLSKETGQDFISSSNHLFEQFKSFNDII